MRRGVYFGVSAAVAVAGAGLIIAAPVTRPLPNVQAPAVELSSGSAPIIDAQYLEWWQIVGGDTAPPSVAELSELDLGNITLGPVDQVPPVNLEVDGFTATFQPPA